MKGRSDSAAVQVTGSHGINVEPPRPPLIRGIIR